MLSAAVAGARAVAVGQPRRCSPGPRRRPLPPIAASVSAAGAPSFLNDLPCCVGIVHRTDSRGQRFEFYIVGTVHTPSSASAEEVRAVIDLLEPDAVMLELDQERLDAVVASSSDTSAATPLSRGGLPYALASPRGYGADFAEGARAAEDLGALVVLGDSKARSLPEELRRRLFAPPEELLDAPRLLRSLLYIARALGFAGASGSSGGGGGGGGGGVVYREGLARAISFPEALAADSGKLRPLQGPALVGVLAALTAVNDAVHPGAAAAGGGAGGSVLEAVWSAADALLSAATVLAAGRAVEVLLIERDDVLTASAARAAVMSAALRRGELWRVSHGFTADPDATAAAMGGGGPEGVPCFTLRRPLGAGEERRLNLFEPRWLALMDRLAEENGGQLEGASLGCMLGVNRRYVSSDWLSRAGGGGGTASGSSGGGGGFGGNRDADLVVEQWLRMARVVRVSEGRRAITGARKLEVWIEGASNFVPAVAGVSPHPAGYLVADVGTAPRREGEPDVMAREARGRGGVGGEPEAPVRCVCVVGLAHCNGMVARLTEMEMDGNWRGGNQLTR